VTDDAVWVAPREIVDIVHRASRVHGCSASLADRIAADVAHCEVHHGGGLQAWSDLVDQSSARLVDAGRAAYRLDLAELAVQRGEVAVETWDPPIPFALLARGLAELAARGVRWPAWPDELTGTDEVTGIELSSGEWPDQEVQRHRHRNRQVLAEGLAVDGRLWRILETTARHFLMSEAVLDGALD
jgi:hypothetical protein